MSGPNLRKHISPHGRVTAVSMMKDEAPFLLEWFAHHMAVGFTDILVYTNDCSDGTDDMLIRLEELGLGYHRRNDIPEGIKPQPSAIKYAQKERIVQDSDWVILFDADEFLSINFGDGKIDSMLTEAGDANGIIVTWRTFGSGGVVEWSRDPVTEQYLYAAPHDWNKGWGVKTLFRFDEDHWKLGIHRPKMKAKTLKTDYPDSVKWLNGSGEPMEDYFKYHGWRSIRRTVGFNWVQLNHYAIKSVDSYAIRKFRGNVNNKKDKYNADYWSLQDRNEVRDISIQRYNEERAQIVKELLKDPVLNRLHFAALERVEATLSDYKKTDAYSELLEGLKTAGTVPITQVSAKPPKARDPKRIANIMSDVNKAKPKKSNTENDEPKSAPQRPNWTPSKGELYCIGPIDLSRDLAVEEVENHQITLPADPRIFTSDAIRDIAKGKFLRKEARLRSFLLSSSDRLLEIGGGTGFLAMASSKMHCGLSALMFENRKDLRDLSIEIAKKNDLSVDQFKASASFDFDLDESIAFKPTAIVLNGPLAAKNFEKLCEVPTVTRFIFASQKLKSKKRMEIFTQNGFAAPSDLKRGAGRVFDRKRA